MASDKDGRGFAGMDPEEQRKIASLGGKAAHERGVAHEFSHREAVEAGRKGGETVSGDRSHMAEIGRKGGEAAGNHRGGQRAKRQGGRGDGGYGEEAREFLEKEIKHHVEEKGMPQDQAVAAAMSEARRKGLKAPEEKRD